MQQALRNEVERIRRWVYDVMGGERQREKPQRSRGMEQ